MENEFKKNAGMSLMFGVSLGAITMLMHPRGGSLSHILKIKSILIFSHSLAIFSLPFLFFGFYGISILLLTRNKISIIGLVISSMGIVAVLIAGTINGLTIPLFLSAEKQNQSSLIVESIVRFGLTINKPLAYIFMLAISFAILIWSVLIIVYAKLPKWIGFYGVFIFLLVISLLSVKINTSTMPGFGFFLLSMLSWFILIGINMSFREIIFKYTRSIFEP